MAQAAQVREYSPGRGIQVHKRRINIHFARPQM
jgi:hypothetical protein